MQSFVTSTKAAFKAALTAGAVVLTVAGASLAAAAPAEAAVRHGGGFHHVGGFHRLGGFHGGYRFGGFGFHHGGFGHRGFAVRRFAYGIGRPYGRYGIVVRHCPVGTHRVPGLGCRVNRNPVVYGYRPLVFGARRVVHPVGSGYRGFGHGHGGFVGGYGFQHAGGVHHGGHFRRH